MLASVRHLADSKADIVAERIRKIQHLEQRAAELKPEHLRRLASAGPPLESYPYQPRVPLLEELQHSLGVEDTAAPGLL
eukprot:2299440-Alexandrium_andersonii.AAC.1